MTTHTATTTPDVTVRIFTSHEQVRGKLADAEIAFHTGPLAGLKLLGFAVWERRTGGGFNVTFPARQYVINGERRSYALLRPFSDAGANDAIRALILEAFREHEAAAQEAGA
jgi:hypothetical protein